MQNHIRRIHAAYISSKRVNKFARNSYTAPHSQHTSPKPKKAKHNAYTISFQLCQTDVAYANDSKIIFTLLTFPFCQLTFGALKAREPPPSKPHTSDPAGTIIFLQTFFGIAFRIESKTTRPLAFCTKECQNLTTNLWLS